MRKEKDDGAAETLQKRQVPDVYFAGTCTVHAAAFQNVVRIWTCPFPHLSVTTPGQSNLLFKLRL